ncbi:DUF443 family protein [Loigolactobacillus binensis]|uniref:DUF443 family protein n=1 Tax=Loigolactobacillus binensis TaxID=2559922 RepID=A0ABW3EFV6_9LACO|nr:DUF443 family protein [Loigolactobacillus binensis]
MKNSNRIAIISPKKSLNIYRYRIVYINNKIYLMDLFPNLINIFFPFMIWFAPQIVYEVRSEKNEDIKRKLKPIGKINTTKTMIPILILVGVLSQLTELTVNFFELNISNNLALILIIAGAILVGLFGIFNNHRQSNILNVDHSTCKKLKIKIIPKQWKNIFMVGVVYLAAVTIYPWFILLSMSFPNIFIILF